MSSNIANQLGLNYKIGKKVSIDTANAQNIYGYSIILDFIELGDIKINNVEATIIEGNQPEQILLGMSFLKFLELNYANNKLELKLSHSNNTNTSNNTNNNINNSNNPADSK